MARKSIIEKKTYDGITDPVFTKSELDQVVNFWDPEPFDVLGPHFIKERNKTAVNAFLPRAQEAWLCLGEKRQRMEKIHDGGIFQAVLPGVLRNKFGYKIGYADSSGYEQEASDPYAFEPTLTKDDVYLLHEGNHFQSFKKLGAHLTEIDGVEGVQFAVWAPNARAVSVVGNFNHWWHGAHPMKKLHNSGIWGLFIPGLKDGEVYKYAIRTPFEDWTKVKTDPYGFAAELRPQTASVVADLSSYKWTDREWIRKRTETDPQKAPISIYEVHLGSWKRKAENNSYLDYKTLAHQIVEYVKDTGYTHVELLPIMEHPFDGSWGYQVVNYFAPSSRFGKPHEFKYFVDYCHKNGIGVILDWVPGHFPKDEHGLGYFDGKQIFAYEDWRKGEHKEWGTFVFDYGRNEVRNFLISNALFWLEEYHIDGLRVDAVASMLYLDYSRENGEWVANVFGGRENLEAIDFMKRLNELVHLQFKGTMVIAEESTAWPGVSKPTYAGGLGFTLKWNMGWMHDSLEYFTKDPIYRRYQHGMLSFSLVYAFSENFVLPISHDEVVHGKRSLLEKMPGDDWQKFANLRLFLGYMFTHPGKKLLFMGQEFGQRGEWNANQSLDWHLLNYEPHQQVRKWVQDLNHLYKSNRALHEMDCDSTGFEWVDYSDADSGVLSYLRWSKDRSSVFLIVCSMTPVVRESYRVGVPYPGFYKEVLNSDAAIYGGSGVGNMGGFAADPVYWNGRPFSLNLRLPPLGVCVFQWTDHLIPQGESNTRREIEDHS